MEEAPCQELQEEVVVAAAVLLRSVVEEVAVVVEVVQQLAVVVEREHPSSVGSTPVLALEKTQKIHTYQNLVSVLWF